MHASMRTKKGLTFTVALTTVMGLVFAGWTHSSPASAQAQDDSKAGPPPMMMRGGPAAIAASGDYIYVLRGGTVYQMKSADLSLVTQKDLPAPGAPAAAAGAAGQ